MTTRLAMGSAHITDRSGGHALAWFRGIGIALLASVFVAVCARITLPLGFTPVPLTLQPFAVLLIGMVLSPRVAAGSLAAYLLEGAAGLPVFTPGTIALTGVAHLFGPTGGYLLAYPFAAFIIARLWNTSTKTLVWAVVATAAGNLLILATGAVWMSVYTHGSMYAVLAQSVVPFLPGDALKVLAAATLGFEWYRVRPARRSAE